MSLLSLPNELLLQIAKNLGRSSLKQLLEAYPHLTFLIPLLEAAVLKEHKIPTVCWAAKKGFKDLAKILLDNGVDVNTHYVVCGGGWQETPIHLAVHAGNKAMTELLLGRGANIDVCYKHDGNWMTLSQCAVAWGKVNMAQLFLDRRCSINEIDGNDVTPLQIAFKYGNLALAKWLLIE